jgi:uncharacterized SAM-binding protein YcdF (DUF218 family)
MFFYLSKVLDFLVNPLVWIMGLMLFSIFSKKAYRKKMGLRFAVGIFLFFSLDFISFLFLEAWEVPGKKLVDVQKHKVAVVLGGFTVMEAEPFDRVHTNCEADRLLHAVKLYETGKIDYILVTGGTASLWKVNNTEADLAHDLLLTCGVPEKAILIENKSKNTHENAVNSRKLLTEKGLWGDEIILLTSGFHTRRAVACFEKENYKVFDFSTSMRIHKLHWLSLNIYVIPSFDSFYRWNLLIHEYVGFMTYKLLGYC